MFARTCSILVFSLAHLAVGQTSVERVRLPVIFKADQAEIVSSMALEIDRTDYDAVPVAEFDDIAGTPEALAFTRLVEAMRDGTPQQVMELSRLGPNENPANRTQLIEAFQKTYADSWDQLSVHGQYLLGNSRIVIWEVPTPSGPFIRSFTFNGDGGQYLWSDSTSRQNTLSLIDTLLLDAEQVRIEQGLDEPDLAYRYDERLPGIPVDLLFNGHVMRWDVFGPERPDLPVAATYARAFKAFADKDMDGFAGFYTSHSREKFSSWIDEMEADEFAAYHDSVTEAREVRFILDADPVFVVFYNDANRLGYDILIRDGDDFRFTSFYIEGFVDDLLKDRNLFVEPVLARIVALGEDPLDYVPVAAAPVTPPSTAIPDEADEESDPTRNEPDRPSDAPDSGPDSSPVSWLLLVLGLVAVIILFLIFKRRPRQ